FVYDDLVKMDVVLLGHDPAVNLGVPYHALVKKVLFVVVICVSVSTALVGPLTFLGILVVNVTYQWLQTFRHRYLIPGVLFISMASLLFGQLLVEHAFNYTTTIDILINFIGGLYFIWLLLKENTI
ncbi:MAG: iron chelate uptake ABC transporter family permease subunit, partial [Bacilli bacterium]